MSAARFELGVGARKKGQYRKKVTKGLYFTYLGRSPSEEIYIQNCVVNDDVLDVITGAKFENEIFRGYNFTGSRTFHFPTDFWMGLTTVQRYCAAYYVVLLLRGSVRDSTVHAILCLSPSVCPN